MIATSTLVPNVVIAGVRKAGTTSLFQWLSDHPDVCPPSTKGTEFLMDRDSPYLNPDVNYHDAGLEGYGRFYKHHRGEPVVLEASTRYIDQATARRALSSLKPSPHVIFMLREPADRLRSSFYYNRNNRGILNRRTTFDRFVECIRGDRVEEILDLPNGCSAITKRRHLSDLRNEIRCGEYVDLLLLWRNCLPEDHLHIYLFDDLRKDAGTFMQTLAVDIGIAPSFYENYRFGIENQTARTRNAVANCLVKVLKRIVPKTRMTKAAYHRFLRSQTTGTDSLSPTDRKALERLLDDYAPFNRRLADEFSLDLSGWNGKHVLA